MTDKGKSLEDIEKRLRSIEIRLDKLEAVGQQVDDHLLLVRGHERGLLQLVI